MLRRKERTGGTSDHRLGCPHEWEVAMGRFYFHLQADDQIVPDDEGADSPDLSAAEHEAILAAVVFFCVASTCGVREGSRGFLFVEGRGAAAPHLPLDAVLFSFP